MNGQPMGNSMSNPVAIQACGEPVAVVAVAAEQIPNVGDLTKLSDAELWARIETEAVNIRRIEKRNCRPGRLPDGRPVSAGLLLLELKRRCDHGDFEAECKARKVKSQRASEDMRIAEYFPNEKDAGKVSVPRAMALIKRSDDSYGPYENCFACPQWLRDAVTRDYGFPGLDVASSHDMHFGEKILRSRGRRIGPGLDEGLRGEDRLVQPALQRLRPAPLGQVRLGTVAERLRGRRDAAVLAKLRRGSGTTSSRLPRCASPAPWSCWTGSARRPARNAATSGDRPTTRRSSPSSAKTRRVSCPAGSSRRSPSQRNKTSNTVIHHPDDKGDDMKNPHDKRLTRRVWKTIVPRHRVACQTLNNE